MIHDIIQYAVILLLLIRIAEPYVSIHWNRDSGRKVGIAITRWKYAKRDYQANISKWIWNLNWR